MAPQINPSQRIRIAIAFAALKFKSPSQSLPAYMLDLCAKFPSSSNSAVDAWQKRALVLEQSLGKMQKKYEREHIKLLSLSANVSASPSIQLPPSPTPTPSSTKKKQKKKVPPQAPVLPTPSPRIDLEAALNGVYANFPAVSVPDRDKIIPSLRLLNALTDNLGNQKSPETSLLRSISIQVLESVGELLQSALSSKLILSWHVDVTKTATLLLCHLLSTVVTELVAKSKGRNKGASPASIKIVEKVLDDILGCLALRIFIPVICSFAPISHLHVSSVLSSRNTKNSDIGIDIRPDLLSLWDVVVNTLDTLTSDASANVLKSIGSVKETMSLEVVRQLDKLYPERKYVNVEGLLPQAQDGSARVRSDRVDNLAKKDALWYLCSVLHLTSSSKTVAPLYPVLSMHAVGLGTPSLLQEEILAILSGFMRRMNVFSDGRSSGIDEVQYGMLLCVLERAWLNGPMK